jgi:hypothetical protein
MARAIGTITTQSDDLQTIIGEVNNMNLFIFDCFILFSFKDVFTTEI